MLKLADEGETSIKSNFISYLNGYTDNIKTIIDRSGIRAHINKLHEEKILFTLLKDFSEIDLSPTNVSNIKMGYIFEELVRKFSEANNAEAGEHYTPREVIDLMIHLLDMDEKAIKDGELVKAGELSSRDLAAAEEHRKSGTCTRRGSAEVLLESLCIK